jgi:curli production assembly/transport component CsgF
MKENVMWNRITARIPAGIVCGFALWAGGAGATELVYVPVNPNFGGAPNNAPGLLAAASATNKHGLQSGLGGSSLSQSPLQQFNQTLERMVLSQLASSATSKLMGQDGKLIPGTFSTENFIITVTDLGGGILRVTTTERATGVVTSFEVGQ